MADKLQHAEPWQTIDWEFGHIDGVNPAIISRFITENKRERRDIRMETAAKLAETLGLRLHHWPR